MKVIAIGHRQRVGKDTAGRFIISHLRATRPDLKCDHMSIFDPVKDIAADLFGWAGMQNAVYYENHPEYKDRLLPAIGKTPRQVMLELGYYLIQISDRIVPELAFKGQSCDLFVIAGLRRLVEIDYVRKFNGVIINIERDVPKLENTMTGHPAYQLDTQLDDYKDWDHVVKNDGSLRDFNRKVCDLTDVILKRFDYGQ